MATETMLSAEHRQVAREFLAASDEEFARGDVLQGAEKLVGRRGACCYVSGAGTGLAVTGAIGH